MTQTLRSSLTKAVARIRRLPLSLKVSLASFYSLFVPSFAFAEGETAGYTDIITALTAQITVGNIVQVLVAVIGASIGIVFFWWAARKVTRVIMSAFRKGRASV